MKPIDTTEPGQTDAIRFEFDLPHPPGKVWRALTDAELVRQWLLPVTDLDLAKGAEFTFTAPPQPGWDGLVRCKYLEIETHRRLRWSWVVGDLDTVVTFTLTPTQSGTHLCMVQSGFTSSQRHNFGGARYGWTMMGGRLVDLLGSIS